MPKKQTLRERTKAEAERLFEYAKKNASSRPAVAKNAVALLRRLAQKSRMRLPQDMKRSFCFGCSAFRVPGKSCVVRVGKRRVSYRCLACGAISRYPYVREQKERAGRK